MYADVTDLYVEQVDGDRYLFDGRWVEMSVREEEFEIAGEDEPVTRTVRATRHGPLLSDFDDDAADVAGAGAGARVRRATADYAVVAAVDRAGAGPDHGRRCSPSTGRGRGTSSGPPPGCSRCPSQNLVYADVDGHIGYQAPGHDPGAPAGRRALAGARAGTPATAGAATIPFTQLPWTLDPPDGVIVTANQAVVDPAGYRWTLGADTAYGYRSQRILDLLATRDDWTVDDTAALQTDTLHPMAEPLVPLLLDQPAVVGVPAAGPAAARGLGRHPAGRLGGGGVLQRGVARPAGARPSRTSCPRRRGRRAASGGSRWCSGCSTNPTPTWWDDVGTDGVREDRDDMLDAGDAAGPRRPDQHASRADPGEWTLGRAPPARAGRTRRSASPASPRWRRCSTAARYELGGGRRGGQRHRLDGRRGLRGRRRCRRCGWWCRWTTWTRPGGSRSAARPDTRSPAHYDDQTDALGRRARRSPWPFTREAVDDVGRGRAAAHPCGLEPSRSRQPQRPGRRDRDVHRPVVRRRGAARRPARRRGRSATTRAPVRASARS